MLKNFNAKLSLPPKVTTVLRDQRMVARIIIGTLLLANLIAAFLVVRPPGGSQEDLNSELANLEGQIAQVKRHTHDLKTITTKVSTAKGQMDAFQSRYFLSRVTTSSTLVSELLEDAKEAGIKTPRAQSFNFEPIEGSDTLEIVTVQADYDCSYEQLVKFLNLVDRSNHLLIIESLQATPRQAAGVIGFTMKVSAFAKTEANT
jgi:hypothetical protein